MHDIGQHRPTLSAVVVSPCFHDNDQLESELETSLFSMIPIYSVHRRCCLVAEMLTAMLVLIIKTDVKAVTEQK